MQDKQGKCIGDSQGNAIKKDKKYQTISDRQHKEYTDSVIDFGNCWCSDGNI